MILTSVKQRSLSVAMLFRSRATQTVEDAINDGDIKSRRDGMVCCDFVFMQIFGQSSDTRQGSDVPSSATTIAGLNETDVVATFVACTATLRSCLQHIR